MVDEKFLIDLAENARAQIGKYELQDFEVQYPGVSSYAVVAFGQPPRANTLYMHVFVFKTWRPQRDLENGYVENLPPVVGLVSVLKSKEWGIKWSGAGIPHAKKALMKFWGKDTPHKVQESGNAGLASPRKES